MSEWQPIETAPKDGNCVILGSATLGAEPAFWHNGSGNYWGLAGWYAERDRGILLARPFGGFTHWQPLPEPPK